MCIVNDIIEYYEYTREREMEANGAAIGDAIRRVVIHHDIQKAIGVVEVLYDFGAAIDVEYVIMTSEDVQPGDGITTRVFKFDGTEALTMLQLHLCNHRDTPHSILSIQIDGVDMLY